MTGLNIRSLRHKKILIGFDMKLLIAVPTQDYIHYKFARSLLWLAVKLARSGIDFDVDFRAW